MLRGNRPYAAYWTGGLLSNVGTWLQNVTASVLVFNMTHSTFMVGVLNMATFAPVFALSIYGGMLSDRFDPRRVIMVNQTISLAIATLITVLSGLGALNAGLLIVLAGGLGSAYALAKPGLTSLLPALVDRKDLAHATAVNNLQFNFGQVAGSGLSAVILAVSGPTVAFALNAVSFLGPITAMWVMRNVDLGKRKVKLRGSGLEGLKYAVNTPAILILLSGVALSYAAVEAIRTLAPDLSHPSARAGVLITAYGIGATVGLVCFGQLSKRLDPIRMLWLAFGCQAVGMIGVTLTGDFVVTCASAPLIGFGFALNIPVLTAALQLSCPDEMRGRISSLFSMIHLGLRPAFALLAGGLAGFVDARATIAIFVLFPLIGVSLGRSSGRTILDAEQPAGDAGELKTDEIMRDAAPDTEKAVEPR
jgi:MFS family permease